MIKTLFVVFHENQSSFSQLFQNPMTVIAIIALVSPLLTALINNCHDTKKRKLDIEADLSRYIITNEITILSNALEALGQISGSLNYHHRDPSITTARLFKAIPYVEEDNDKELILFICEHNSDSLESRDNSIGREIEQIERALSVALLKRSNSLYPSAKKSNKSGTKAG